MKKRYALFYGTRFYPEGGWDDFIGIYATVADAIGDFDDYTKNLDPEYELQDVWGQVVDLKNLKVVHYLESR